MGIDGRIENELKIESSIENKKNKIPSYVYAWYLNLKASQKTAATRRDFIHKVCSFLSYIDENIMNVKPEDINEINVTEYFISIQTKDKNGSRVYTSDSYRQTVWSCLNSFFEYLYKRNMIPVNYMNVISRPKNNDLIRINEDRVLLTAKDFKKIINSVECVKNKTHRLRDKSILFLFMNTGMRKTALCNIMLDDIDFDKKELVVIDKGNKRHIYYLDEQLERVLKDWIDVRHNYLKGNNNNHLFLSDHGNAISEGSVYNLVEKYTKKALGKAVSPHKLRSGYCSILYKKTGDIEFVRRAVGHANAATTQRYIVTKGEEKKRAAEIMGSIF